MQSGECSNAQDVYSRLKIARGAGTGGTKEGGNTRQQKSKDEARRVLGALVCITVESGKWKERGQVAAVEG